MTAYIYCADLHCADCAAKISDQLDKQGKRPEQPDDDRTFDSDDYPKHAGDDGGGESDCPQHCGTCGVPLNNPLTDDGVRYVLDAIRDSIAEALEQGRGLTWDRVIPLRGTAEEELTYWHGSRHVEITREWAQQVSNYNLEKDDQAIVTLFLELSEKP